MNLIHVQQHWPVHVVQRKLVFGGQWGHGIL